MAIPEPAYKIGAFLIEHVRAWGWAIVGWFSRDAQRNRQIARLLDWLGRIRRESMKQLTNRQYDALIRQADDFGRVAMDFHNGDPGASPSVPMPPWAAAPPLAARTNTDGGHAGLSFWIEWHRKQLLNKRRDGERARQSTGPLLRPNCVVPDGGWAAPARAGPLGTYRRSTLSRRPRRRGRGGLH